MTLKTNSEACIISITFHFETATVSLQRTIITIICASSLFIIYCFICVVCISIQDGATALTEASENGFNLIVETLCKAGANVDHTNAVS